MIKESSLDIKLLLSILQSVTIFSGFDEERLRQICERCSIIDAEAGDILLQEKTPATEIFILLKGKVNIVLNLKDEPLEVIEYGPGNCIGEASVIGIQDHSASAVVTENASLLVLSRQVLMDLFESNKDLFALLILNIARELARRLHRTDEILLRYGKIDKKSQPVLKSFTTQEGQ